MLRLCRVKKGMETGMFDKTKLWEDISVAERVGIAGHIRPDGDCIGSCIALYNYISENYTCDVDVYAEEIPSSFEFLWNSDEVNTVYPDVKPYDVFIALDCGDVDRLGKAEKYLKKAVHTYCIDHHGTNTGFAENNLILPGAAATSEILFDLFENESISKNTAEALYLGIVHDTGVFKHSNTTRHTMETAGILLEKGISSSKIIDETFYEKTYLQNQILGRCLMESILCMNGKVIISAVDRKVQLLYGLDTSDTDGVIDQLRITKGVEVAILLKEMNPRVWRVSMRSCYMVDVAKICNVFGGGGHVRAAGCTLNGSMYDVINTLTKEIEKQGL